MFSIDSHKTLFNLCQHKVLNVWSSISSPPSLTWASLRLNVVILVQHSANSNLYMTVRQRAQADSTCFMSTMCFVVVQSRPKLPIPCWRYSNIISSVHLFVIHRESYMPGVLAPCFWKRRISIRAGE